MHTLEDLQARGYYSVRDRTGAVGTPRCKPARLFSGILQMQFLQIFSSQNKFFVI